jgi:hypothetical protein
MAEQQPIGFPVNIRSATDAAGNRTQYILRLNGDLAVLELRFLVNKIGEYAASPLICRC